ncbi:MAG: chemotaxis protein CheA [Candidatus Parabeggiatoa sp. nov. 2]|nr:MAG: chemotaxis protein CheA [Beggiatoa sp. 4572_84]RKZ63037.1 MAG: chemotaxis protein CheA [Gammaproteobacteria bacterium]
MPIDLTEVRELFFEESFENLDMMESNLLDLEVGRIDKELINGIFRAAHSIKGGAGIFSFEHIVNFAHAAETLLDEMRNGEHIVTQSLIDLLLRSGDVLRMMLSALQENTDYDIQEAQACQDELQSALKDSMENPFADIDVADMLAAPVTKPATSEKPPSSATNKGWRIVFKPDLSMLKTGNDPINLFRELASNGELEVKVDTSQIPAFAELDPQACYLNWELTLLADTERAAIDEIFEWVEDDCELHITALDSESPPSLPLQKEGEPTLEAAPALDKSEAPTVEAAKEPADKREESGVGRIIGSVKDTKHTHSATHHATEANSIRVGIDKIDNLINMVGELVITQSMLDQIGENLDNSHVTQLRDGLAQLERNTRELQESVMRIRMLPISFSFNRFGRLVHDLGTQLGKKVELKLSGEHTELDKTVLEKMSDPLVHLVRNALDHGIETPEQRRAAGKPETGVLHLHAFHQGGNIIIQISDDGAGFDVQKIRAKAIQKGLLSHEERPTNEQLYEFIFQPGFSTIEQVSDLSGRGVGMDVVRRNIRALGGTIEVKSKRGQGSTFSIRLPLTLAILDGQLVRVGQEIYILPLLSIIESLRAKPKLVNSLAGSAQVYRLRDEYIPILRLYDLFGITPRTTQLEQGLLVMVEGDGQKMGLFVDELLSQQQIVIKSLESNYQKVEGISGATILGDGSVALILDVAGLIRLFHTQIPQKRPNFRSSL